MLLLLMRHGIAEEPELWSGDDTLRPLTKSGVKQTRAAARGLSDLAPRVDLIASSPLVRARQTGEIAREFFPDGQIEIWDELEEAEYSALCARLKKVEAQTVLLVGHEPGCSSFVARILSGKAAGFAVEFKKAGVCALEVEWSTRAPRATLLWHATPKILRAMI
jgi:phosphohistidine phosphatase